MQALKIVVPSISDEELKRVKSIAKGVEVVMVQNLEEARREAVDADALYGFCTPEIVQEARRLRWIQVQSAGVEHYLFPELVNSDITLTNASRIYGIELADHIMAMILAFARCLPFLLSKQREEVWESRANLRSVELQDMTLLIVGLGGVGTETARRAAAFGMHIIATEIKEMPRPNIIEYIGKPEELHSLLPKADWVAICVPLTPKTRKLFGRREFNLMKPTAYLINVTRGGIVDIDALVEALREGKIAGAGLDVTDPEPLPQGHPLWKMENVIITPHSSGQSQGADIRMFNLFCENLHRFVSDEPLTHVVDKLAGY